MTIKRVWHGWTIPGNAAAYREILFEDVIPGIEAKGIRGYRGIEVLEREMEDEVEFVTIMTFDSLQSVIDFQGEDYHKCYVPDVARRVLNRWDRTSAHFTLRGTREYG